MAQVEVPTAGASGSGAAAAPPPPAAAPAPAAATTPAPAAARRTAKPIALRIGSYGAAVRDLQRELRRRGIRVVVDGAFGPATKRAVKRIQKRFKMKPTGVANAKLLKRLGLQVRTTAGAPAPARARITPGRSPYLDVFPVAGDYTYSDDYGAARHQGSHEGVDIMADRGTPVVAVANATVSRLARAETGLGGLYVWLERADGTEYYFAHLNSVAAGLQDGQAVSAGQVIGTVGNTGDARYGATHLHFEIRPGGSPIDPYPHLVAVDPTAR
jgi:murein DD-endopeptidase MepM/ murein hydrolase activator NlpD